LTVTIAGSGRSDDERTWRAAFSSRSLRYTLAVGQVRDAYLRLAQLAAILPSLIGGQVRYASQR
jgi:hypothetical protein